LMMFALVVLAAGSWALQRPPATRKATVVEVVFRGVPQAGNKVIEGETTPSECPYATSLEISRGRVSVVVGAEGAKLGARCRVKGAAFDVESHGGGVGSARVALASMPFLARHLVDDDDAVRATLAVTEFLDDHVGETTTRDASSWSLQSALSRLCDPRRRGLLALGSSVVPVWSSLEERAALGRLGAYGGVDYVVDRIVDEQGDLFYCRPNATLWLRPKYPLVPRLERRWPVAVAESELSLFLTSRDYAIATAVSTLLSAAGALLAASLVAAHVFALSVVPGFSMVPFVRPGDVLLVNKFSRTPPTIGDVVFFEPPPALLAVLEQKGQRLDARTLFLKRVAALPGDTVTLDARTLAVTVNGQPARSGDESSNDGVCADAANFRELRRLYAASHRRLTEEEEDRSFVVPDGSLYVLGDCPAVSVDSRVWGPLPKANVVGKDALTLFHSSSVSSSATRRSGSGGV